MVNTATVSGGGDPGCPAAALQLNDDDTVERTATDGNEDRKRGIVCSRCTSQLHTATEQHGHGSDDGGDHDHRHHPNRADDWHLASGLHGSGQTVTRTVAAGLAAGGGTSFVIPVTPTLAATPSVTNTATASGGGDSTCPAARCSGTVTTPVNLPNSPSPRRRALQARRPTAPLPTRLW